MSNTIIIVIGIAVVAVLALVFLKGGGTGASGLLGIGGGGGAMTVPQSGATVSTYTPLSSSSAISGNSAPIYDVSYQTSNTNTYSPTFNQQKTFKTNVGLVNTGGQ